MVIPFEELKNYNFSVSDVNVIHQKPVYRQLAVEKRLANGFLYIISGEGKYIFEGGQYNVSSGTVIYLPSSSKHKFIITSSEIEFYRVDFTIRIQGELALFSVHPVVITDSAPSEFAEDIRFLEQNYLFENNTIVKTEKICKMFSALQKTEGSLRAKKIAPAVCYINEHLAEGFSCQALAEMCYLSTSQFYKLFVEEYKMTPLEYRDTFLLRRAKLLLKSEGISVSEAAYMLGFDNPAYFSRFFKKNTGISPKDYKNKTTC